MRYAKIYFEDLQPGDAMPALVKPPIQQIQLTRYAGASGDFNPIHQDDAFAKAAGMGGVFAHGMLSMGFVAQSVTDWLEQVQEIWEGNYKRLDALLNELKQAEKQERKK